eukprot:TRINITY_DN14720_c0_g1_i4.p1 TRINITY_DN14720_c0_g1~~TRINITY_DN14720_c0_g1_i4.p1  ORF type:complete len:105 (-),score=30.08 TRINITY_DN14720_c0_g1_i4:36-350(-)
MQESMKSEFKVRLVCKGMPLLPDHITVPPKFPDASTLVPSSTKDLGSFEQKVLEIISEDSSIRSNKITALNYRLSELLKANAPQPNYNRAGMMPGYAVHPSHHY